MIEHSTEHTRERAVLAGLSAPAMEPDERSDETSMAELAALLETAGGQAVAVTLQQRDAPDPRSFLGAGKVRELKSLIEANECTLAVFDNELSPSQARVLEAELGVRVLDRSGLILDIFASRAATHEGRLQVALAQYKYLLPRLTGMWTHLVRQTAAGGSSPMARARLSWRPTGGTSAAASRSWRPSWSRCAVCAPRSAAAARKTRCLSSRWWATPMWARARCSTG